MRMTENTAPASFSQLRKETDVKIGTPVIADLKDGQRVSTLDEIKSWLFAKQVSRYSYTEMAEELTRRRVKVIDARRSQGESVVYRDIATADVSHWFIDQGVRKHKKHTHSPKPPPRGQRGAEGCHGGRGGRGAKTGTRRDPHAVETTFFHQDVFP